MVERPESWWSEFLLSPQVFGALAFLFGVAAAGFGWLSARPDPEPQWAIPPSWVQLTSDTPEADRSLFPESVVEEFQKGRIAAAAAERPLEKLGTDGQLFVAILGDGVLRPDIAQELVTIVRTAPPIAGLPDQEVVTTPVQTLDVRGAAVVSAHAMTMDVGVFVYAVPFGNRSALLFYTCAPFQCPRIQRMSESAVRATGGIAAPSLLHDPLVKLVCRYIAVFSAFAFLALTVIALWLARRAELAEQGAATR